MKNPDNKLSCWGKIACCRENVISVFKEIRDWRISLSVFYEKKMKISAHNPAGYLIYIGRKAGLLTYPVCRAFPVGFPISDFEFIRQTFAKL